jgi:hypothetical protein
MFTKILIANRGVLAHGQAKQNGRAADVSTNRLPQTAQRAATRHTIA